MEDPKDYNFFVHHLKDPDLDDLTLTQYQLISPLLSDSEHRTLAARVGQICGNANLDPETAENIIAIVRQIAGAAQMHLRAALAEAAAEHSELPSEIALKIASDEDAVSTPFLELTQALTDDDLLEIARLTDSNSKRLAISRRKEVSEELSSVLAETGDWPVRKSLLENQGARIAGKTYDLIVVRDGDRSELHQVLVQGRQLPAEIVAKFIRIMETALIERLVTHHGLTAGQAFVMTTDVHYGAIIGLASDISPDRLAALVKYLSAQGEITPYLLFKAICRGNVQFLAVYLAQCAELPVGTVQERIAEDHVRHLPILWRTTGFADDVLRLIVEAVSILKSSADECRKRDVKAQQTVIFQRLISGLETLEKGLSPKEVQELWTDGALA